MRILITGSAGHLGEALVRTLQGASPLAKAVGSKGYHGQSFASAPYPT
jgi:nucleoside-diphosphate-sugar epimerase